MLKAHVLAVFVLSIQTLKSIRKWRDRLYMLRQLALDLVQVRGLNRILFWPVWQNYEESLRRAFRYTRHEVFFAEIPPGGDGYDLVVPLSAEALLAVAGDKRLGARNPLPVPDPRDGRIVARTRRRSNGWMRELGFGRHIPRDVAPGAYLYVLKLRRDSQHLPLFGQMLRAIGFNGLCCVNDKLRDGIPLVFEINPRFGNSLGPFFPAFMRSLDWSRRVRR